MFRKAWLGGSYMEVVKRLPLNLFYNIEFFSLLLETYVSLPINYKIDAICRALKEYGHGSHVSSSVRLKEELFLCWDKLANGCFSISIRNYNIDLAELRRILYGIDLAD
ncbi:hypothetical protein Gotri_004010 [Gossypium trilobum]|uniref:Uncharacterized protein n=1 Tax=Gossypium trilobum TaxID=34281 RepID=A0A7J9F5E5_9ROSI|nr:hypothetical protein [Gossypium trilobum]